MAFYTGIKERIGIKYKKLREKYLLYTKMRETGIKLLSLFNRYFDGKLKQIEMQLLMLLDGQMRVNELCKKAGIRASDGTRYTDNLEKMGYIKKDLSPTDRRCFIVTITDKGNLAVADFQSKIDGLFVRESSSTELIE